MAYRPVPNPATWTQSDWYVDWVGGNDKNDGTSPSKAVKTVNGGVVAKWGTTSPILAQTTTLHILSPQPLNAEEIVLEPIIEGMVQFIILGTPQLVASFSLGTVTSKNRTTNTQFSAAGFTAGGVASFQLVHNTTAGKDSWCFIRSVGAGVAQLTQPLAALVPGVDTTYFPNPAEVDTWAAGDTVSVYVPCLLNLRAIEITGGGASDAAATSPALWLEYLHIPDASGVPGTSVFAPQWNQYILLQSCFLEAYLSTFQPAFQTTLTNCSLYGASINNTFVLGGSIHDLGVLATGTNWFDADAIIEAASGISGEFVMGAMDLLSSIAGHGGVYMRLDPLNTYGAILWGGAGSLNMQSGGTFYNTSGTTWALSVYVPTLQLNGVATGTSYTPGTGLWTSAIALNVTNLDTYKGLQDPISGARFTK